MTENQYKVQITKYALAQIEEIKNYITGDLQSPQAAYRLILEMKTKVASLGCMPKRNPLVSIKRWSEQGIRKIIVNNFIIYYWIDEKQQIVYVTAVVYGKRNQLKELGKMVMNQGLE